MDIGHVLLVTADLGAHAAVGCGTGGGSALIGTTIVTVPSGAMMILVV